MFCGHCMDEPCSCKVYCSACSPIRGRTEGSPVDNVCSPLDLKLSIGHNYCFNCGRKIREEVSKDENSKNV